MKTYSEYRNLAWNSLTNKWNDAALTMFILCIIAVAFNVPSSIAPILGLPYQWSFSMSGVGVAVALLLVLPLEWGFYVALLQMIRGEQGSIFTMMWNNFKTNYTRYLPAAILVMVLTGLLGAVTLGIGFFILSMAYAMVPFLLHDHPELSTTDALKASRELMRGHKWDLFVLHLSFIGWALLGIITCGIAFFWINPYIYTAVAHFYEDITADVTIEVC